MTPIMHLRQAPREMLKSEPGAGLVRRECAAWLEIEAADAGAHELPDDERQRESFDAATPREKTFFLHGDRAAALGSRGGRRKTPKGKAARLSCAPYSSVPESRYGRGA